MRRAWAGLQGLFAVYKAPGVHWMMVRDAVETRLLRDLNALQRPPPRKEVRFLPTSTEGKDGDELTMTVASVPVLADHPLVSGPAFTRLKVGAGHRLDIKSSGVFVLGLGHGNKLLHDLYNAHLSRTYTVRGLFGKATDDFSDEGKLIEKTTFDHITREKLERILSVIQGSHHKALLQPHPPLSTLHLRHYSPPPKRPEPESNEPLGFLKGPAGPRTWSVKRSMGSDHQQPLWRVALLSLTLAGILLWCVLRPETEVDQLLQAAMKGDAAEREPQSPLSEQKRP
nr:PREDICTED: probable tRNA pseudouridine synthase 2 isoform X2 [Anolis carolinensis]|eukprot:XP_008121049.1 PREDICTED: probable tRNA pseudouridine synthase 2 isoform X2 [Anolis carolinensis]